MFIAKVSAQKDENVVEFKDVSTLNFLDKTTNYGIEDIKKICTYDFCDFVRGETKQESLEIFVNNYLKKVDREVASSLKVKGIRITKIILKEQKT